MEQMNQNKSKDPLYDQLSGIVKYYSESFSKVARTIVLSLCGLSWVEYNNHPQEQKPQTVICIVIAYFFLELIQYFVTSVVAHNNFRLYRSKKKEYKEVKESMDDISILTKIVTGIKLIMVFIISGILFVYFI